MNVLLWILQILSAVLYFASGTMKAFMFERISVDVPSFGALPRQVWAVLGIFEIVCAIALIVPTAFRWHPSLTPIAAMLLAIESLIFVGVHMKYNETGTIIVVCILGFTMAFIAYGRFVLRPIV